MIEYFECLKKNSAADFNLFCFPHAGGTVNLFKDWINFLPENYNVYVLSLPGRGRKTLEEKVIDMNLLMENISKEIETLLDKPFVFWGHSMGALISYELAKKVGEKFAKKPSHLYVSSYPAPHLPNGNLVRVGISDEELITRLTMRNGTSKEILANRKFLKILLPVLRADYLLLSSYSYIDTGVLTCPITASIGTQDNITVDQAQEWSKQTNNMFRFIQYDGDHFYLNDINNKKFICSLIVDNMKPF